MKLNLKSWHATLYLNLFRNVPSTLCPYFWKLMLAILLLPFTWAGFCVVGVREERNIGLNMLLTLATYMIIFAGFGIGKGIVEPVNTWSYILSIILGVIVLVGGVSLFWSIIYGCFKLYDYINDRIEEKKHQKYMERVRNNVPPKKYVVSEWWKGFKGKYCPRIDWN